MPWVAWAAAASVVAGVLGAGALLVWPVHAVRYDCGSVVRPVEPDPSIESEYGCRDAFSSQKQYAVAAAFVGGPLLAVQVLLFGSAVSYVRRAVAGRRRSRLSLPTGSARPE